MSKRKHTIRILMVNNKIVVEALDTTHISHHVSGTFLIKYRPKEISITQEAKDALMKCSEGSGKVRLRFSRGNVLSWANTAPGIIVALKHISVPEYVKSIINRFDIIE